MSIRIELKGRRFSRLVVVEQAPSRSKGLLRWLCQCDCGKTVVALGDNLRKGTTKSCGCFHLEQAARNFGKRANFFWIDYQGSRYMAAKFLRQFGAPGINYQLFKRRVLRGIDPMAAATAPARTLIVKKAA